ncbi:hypothetical protein SCO12_12170 [Legionella pneumophila serogroup 10]
MDDFIIELKCLFSDQNLTGIEGKEYTSGDLIVCTNCNKSNLYDSLLKVAIEKAKEKMSNDTLEAFKSFKI